MRYLLCLLIILIFYSCKRRTEISNDKIAKKVNRIFEKNDSLSKIFAIKKFEKNIDTLNFIIKENPEQVFVTEYYCASCYTVSYMKILMLSYKDQGSMYLFKYDRGLSAWVESRYLTVSKARIRELNNKILRNTDWKTKSISDPQTSVDIFRYRYYAEKSKNATVLAAYDPSSELLDIIGSSFR